MESNEQYLARRRFLRLAALSALASSLDMNVAWGAVNNAASGKGHDSRPTSFVHNAKGKSYVVANGQPYLMYGIQIRIDWSGWKPGLGSDWSVPDAYFKAAKDIGFKTVVVPVYWSYIEPKEGAYDYSYIDHVVESADRYDLAVQILWYGTDVCGYSIVPDYVRDDRNRFPKNQQFDAFFDLSAPDLVEKECATLTSLMNRIADYDKQRRIIMVQIENEPDGAGDLEKTIDWGDTADKTAKMYAGNQLDAAADLMNALGMAVHTSRRNVVTRCNVGTPFRALELYHAIRNAGSGVDIIGVDTYSNDTAVTKDVLNTIPITTIGNVAHQPEGEGSAPNIICMVLSDFEEGGGFLLYDLSQLMRGKQGENPSFWSIRDGTKMLDYVVDGIKRERPELKTDLLRSFNLTIYKVDKRIAVAPKGMIAAFNIDCNDGDWQQQRVVGGVSVGFYTSNGGQALAILDFNGDLILLNIGDAAVFTFDQGYVQTGGAPVGYFDENNLWHEQERKPFAGNTLKLAAGDVVRLSRTF